MTLVQLAEKYGTDKEWYHGYMSGAYETLLAPYKDKPIRLLEIGIFKGESLKVWRDYFTHPDRTIIGVDVILPGELLPGEQDGVTMWEADAYDPEFVEQQPRFDIIIDDGPHTHDSQVAFLQLYYPKLKPGGLLICEDIASPHTRAVLREMRLPTFVMNKTTEKGKGSDSYLMAWSN